MTILKEAIQGDLCERFLAITGVPFIQANPQPLSAGGDPDLEVVDTTRPKGTYGTVNILNINDTGIADRVDYENEVDDVNAKISGHRLIQVSINVFRREAFDVLNKLYTALQRPSSIEYFASRGLGYQSRSDVRDVTLPSGGSLEERYQMDLFIYKVATDEEIVLAIDSLTVSGVIDSGAQIVKTVEIEVDNT